MADDFSLDSMFTEPERPPTPQATYATYTRESDVHHSSWKEISIRLVGSHPLWGHHLWNAARAFATYLDVHRKLYSGKNVLELGAGGALPSIVTAKNGAKRVVITDYPDRELLDNIDYNLRENHLDAQVAMTRGYIWGHGVAPLLACLDDGEKFDLIVLSDLVFNHSQHDALLKTCLATLSPNGVVLVFFTHHRPHLALRDMEFFAKAKENGWKVSKVLTRKYPPMFPEDPGEEDVRATVHGWRLVLGTHTQEDSVIEDEKAAAPAETSSSSPNPKYLSIASGQPFALQKPVKKTLILDLNGTLVYRTKGRPHSSQSNESAATYVHPVYGASPRSVNIRLTYPRPYLPSFINYLKHPSTQAWLDAVVWSSARPESVDEMLSHAGFVRHRGKWEGLKDVWARDKLGLSVEAYHHKTETVKDLTTVIRALYSLPSNQADEYTARNAVLLDDTLPHKKARLQPYNLLQVSEYDKEDRRKDVEALKSIQAPKKKKERHRKRDKEPKQIEAPTMVEHETKEDVVFEPTLLAVIGILERAVKGQGNVSAWIKNEGIGKGVWYETEDCVSFWVKAGIEVLEERDIRLESGVSA